MTTMAATPLADSIAPPSWGQLADYAARHRLRIPVEDLDACLERVSAELAVFDRLRAVPVPPVPPAPLRHPDRDPGRRPAPGEDPCNALIRRCRVRGAPSGPLAGWRIGVKDCIAVAGIPLTNGGRRTPYPVPAEDAAAVERLLDAGAVIVAKTNMADMSLGLGESSAFGPVRNPRNPDYSAGGSSSGSGAAVAAGLVDAALGGDQGGSVRIPAAWCGIVGMKATHGLVPSHGMTHLDLSVDAIGPMTATVADNAAMLEVLAGGDRRDPQCASATPPEGRYRDVAGRDVAGLRIGIVAESADPEICAPSALRALARVRAVLEDRGAVVRTVSVPLWPHATTIIRALTMFSVGAMACTFGQGIGDPGRIDLELLDAAAAEWRLRADRLPPAMQARLLAAEHVRDSGGAVLFGQAQNLRAALRRQVAQAFGDLDVLLTPTTPRGPAPLRGPGLRAGCGSEATAWAAYNTCPFSLTGHPALTLPCGAGEHNLPVAVQIAGRHFAESTVYSVAFALEDDLGPAGTTSVTAPDLKGHTA